MSRYINNWMKWWRCSRSISFGESLRRFVNYRDQPHSNSSPLDKKRLGRVNPRVLLLLLTIAIICACSSTAIKHSEVLTSKTPSTPCEVVQHAMGEACVPNDPKRVVTIQYSILANVLALGIQPIAGSGLWNKNWELNAAHLRSEDYPNLGNRVENIKYIGLPNAISVEKVLQLKPDLILGWDGIGESYSLLSQIAPTVTIRFADIFTNWKEAFNLTAKVLGKQVEAQEVWNHYDGRIEQLKMALGNRYQNQTISIVTARRQEIYIFLKSSFAGSILDDLGLQVFTRDSTIDPVSEEKLDLIDGDILFFLSDSIHGEALARLKQRPLWQTLTAVQKNQVYSVNPLTWTGNSPLDADAVIDDLYKYLVNTP